MTIAILAFTATAGAWAAVMVAFQTSGSPPHGGVYAVLLAISGLLAYMLPTIVAWCLNHPHLLGILAINAVFGWTLIGWMAAMVWAVVPVAPVDRRRGTLVRFD